MDKQLRDDLDVFCTTFLRWGSWGNHGSDPRIVLNTIAADTARREIAQTGSVTTNSGEVGGYVVIVLERADLDVDEANRIGRQVQDIFYTITCGIEFEKMGRDLLDFQRTQPRHKAIDPASDPRWGLKPKKLTSSFRDGMRVEAWAYGQDDYLEEREIVSSKQLTGSDIHLLHRDDGPALIRYRDEKVVEEVWIYKGRLHRTDGPAHTLYGTYRRWYLDDILQSEEMDDSTDQP